MSEAMTTAAASVWPDWSGRDVAIIASGPSVRAEEVALLKGRMTTFAIKKNIELAPWAEAVYGCDFPWWRHVKGLPNYTGVRLAYAPRAAEYGALKVEIPDVMGDRLLFGRTGAVGAGGCSGFQALNLAVQFGAKRLLLVGYDCQDRSGVHWYGRNTAQGMGNPTESNFRRWRTAFGTAAEQLRDLGVEVVNASQLSELKCFKRWSVADTLKAWGC